MLEEPEKEQVTFGLSGKLMEDTNTVNGIVVRYSEPLEAKKPRTKWRLYVFKGNEELPILYVHR
jgi:smad nuclear-interacting protein 1